MVKYRLEFTKNPLKIRSKIHNEEYLIVDEYAILAIIKDPELLDLVDVEDNE